MSKKRAISLLKNNSKSPSLKRIALLELLMGNRKALALTEIEKLISVPMNRVTIYRTLHTFEEIGLVIKILDNKGVGLYMFNHEDHSDSSYHPHLRCKECERVICLPELPQDYMQRLKNYKIDHMHFLLEGTCRECATMPNKKASSEQNKLCISE